MERNSEKCREMTHVNFININDILEAHAFRKYRARARSSSVYPSLLHTRTHFFRVFRFEAMTPKTLINHFHFDSVLNVQNRQYFCMNYILMFNG